MQYDGLPAMAPQIIRDTVRLEGLCMHYIEHSEIGSGDAYNR